ncbi:MAG: hypothetical protein IKD18_05040, partial [Clostridia bacterium]|nr:hypothetical protein [Clostridia bacterium]
WIENCDFSALYDRDRNLYFVGFDPDSKASDGPHYDHLFSEARITSFLGIALGHIPSIHWSSLARPLVSFRGRAGAASWSGTAFEYFMPPLFLPVISNSLEDETLDFALYCQKSVLGHASEKEAVYGISESAYSATDHQMNFQYKAFGIPYLSVLDQSMTSKVISPYSSFLMLERKDSDLLRNLKALENIGMVGKFGFYDACEFHSNYLSDFTVIPSCMAHHKAMSVLALSNELLEGALRSYFLSYRRFGAKKELLAERFPIEGRVIRKKSQRVAMDKADAHDDRTVLDYTKDPERGRLFTDAKLSTAVYSDGSCRILWQGKDFADPKTGGLRFFCRTENETITQPDSALTEQSVHFSSSQVEYRFRRKRSTLVVSYKINSLLNAIVLTAELDGFAEQLTFGIEFDCVMQNERDYSAHPAFQALSLELSSSHQHLMIRKRGIDNHEYAHVLTDEDFEVFIDGEKQKGTFCDRMMKNPKVSLLFSFDSCKRKTIHCAIAFSKMSDKPFEIERLFDSLVGGNVKAGKCNQLFRLDRDALEIENQILISLTKPYRHFFNGDAQPFHKSELWRHGVSGDVPILTYEQGAEDEKTKVGLKRLLRVYKKMVLAGLSFDLVILQKSVSDYFDPMREWLSELLAETQCEFLIGRHPGIHVCRTEDECEKQPFVLHSFLAFPQRTPKDLMQIEECDLKPEKKIFQKKTLEQVGSFSEEGFCLKKECFSPKVPFSHVISNRVCGFVCDQNSLGFTWHRNAGLNRISKWENLPDDETGEKIYLLYDGVWRDLLQQSSTVTYQNGFISYEGNLNGNKYKIIATVSEMLAGKIVCVETEGALKGAQAAYSFVPSLGPRPRSRIRICDLKGGFYSLDPILRDEYRGSAYFYTDGENVNVSQWNERILFSCQAKDSTVFVLGGYHGDRHLNWLSRNLNENGFQRALAREKEFRGAFNAQKLGTEEFWIRYQTVYSRFFGRTGLYQSSGAYGFRDQLQDSLAFLSFAPAVTRNQILRCCAHQFTEGDVQHWWHPLKKERRSSNPGVRTRCSDDYLWLPFAVSVYIDQTGDQKILKDKAPFLHGDLLKDGADEAYFVPSLGKSETVTEHLERAAHLFLNRGLGVHGLPRIGSGDWNDGMNRLDGESLWLGFFSSITWNRAKKYLSEELKNQISLCIEKMSRGLSESFNGHWFPRAFLSDGKILGNDPMLKSECSIDLITQAFAAFYALEFFGTDVSLDVESVKTALLSAYEILVDEKSKTVALFAPPFSKTIPSPGYIQRYTKGVRENGGQYTHAAVWFALALLLLGEKTEDQRLIERGLRVKGMLSPFSKLDQKSFETYQSEPYVLCGDVYTAEGAKGRGGWSWYTGAAGWYLSLTRVCDRIQNNMQKNDKERV